MVQYINKADVVSEIETRYNECLKRAKIIDAEYWNGKADAYRNMLVVLDTLEVKEVDLEKEFDNYTKNILACDVKFEPFTHLYNCAKYFYELGLKSQKGE